MKVISLASDVVLSWPIFFFFLENAKKKKIIFLVLKYFLLYDNDAYLAASQIFIGVLKLFDVQKFYNNFIFKNLTIVDFCMCNRVLAVVEYYHGLMFSLAFFIKSSK